MIYNPFKLKFKDYLLVGAICIIQAIGAYYTLRSNQSCLPAPVMVLGMCLLILFSGDVFSFINLYEGKISGVVKINLISVLWISIFALTGSIACCLAIKSFISTVWFIIPSIFFGCAFGNLMYRFKELKGTIDVLYAVMRVLFVGTMYALVYYVLNTMIFLPILIIASIILYLISLKLASDKLNATKS